MLSINVITFSTEVPIIDTLQNIAPTITSVRLPCVGLHTWYTVQNLHCLTYLGRVETRKPPVRVSHPFHGGGGLFFFRQT